ncbi:MAG: DUF2207 domain-containing protein [Allorhizobium sp.]
MKPVVAFLSALLFSQLLAGSVSAEEAIRDYHADIEVSEDATLTVTETITVNAEGRDIQRGIFRDFPLYAENASGSKIRVDFNLLSVERDGEPEPYHTESISGGTRIYAGSADVFLDPGEYTYTITYTTARQIRTFDDHDELYWNVTGNGWIFPIDNVSATVTLPDGVQPTDTAYFTGAQGDAGKDARASRQDGTVQFETTRPLNAGEGLTVVVGLPKGALAAPSGEQGTWWFLRDNANLIIGFGGLALVFFYYLRAWVRVGRDPEAGVMVPRWDAPDGISPALVNYVDNKGFSGGGWTALAASALDLAVHGYVVLEDLDQSITIRRTEKSPPQKLPAGQASLLSAIGGAGESLTIDKANGTRVQTVGTAFRGAIEKEHRGKYYRGNAGYIAGGVILSIVALAALLLFGDFDAGMVPVLLVPMMLAVGLGGFAVKIGKGRRPGATLISRIAAIVAMAIAGFFAISIVSVLLLVFAVEYSDAHQLPVFIAVGGIVLLNALFFFLMGAPTPVGRKLMDGIEGLRTYLTLAEKDRMNMQGAPKMSPQHFETLLPYAVALGVEKPWSQTFDVWLASAAAGAAAASYQPVWYAGDFSGGRFGDRIGGFSSSMASTIASTLPEPPKSASSGFSSGGGFSGGGGGGGGGGGW